MVHQEKPASEDKNYRLYRSTAQSRTYLVVSTFYDRGGKAAERPEPGFEETSTKELGAEMWRARRELSPDGKVWETSWVEGTLRTHGYNTRFGDFVKQVVDEADSDRDTTLRPNNRFYIGYRWPSVGFGSRRSLIDTLGALLATWSISVLMFLLPVVALVSRIGGRQVPLALRSPLGPYALPLFAAIALGVGIGLLLLRLSTYLSDRYRALHYGVPDLTEFVRDLDDQIYPMKIRADFDLVGHSMGCLLLVNAVRVMTDFFHFPGEATQLSRMAMIRLRSLILCAADIPVALAVPGRNNYFLSSLRRFTGIHVLSSDRDIILKWASNLGNWASEPRFDMSSRRLGNALLIDAQAFPRRLRDTPRLGSLLPVTRPGRRYIAVAGAPWPRSEARGRAYLHFHDCSPCWSLGGDLKWAAGAGIVATLAGCALWFSPWGSLAKWAAVLLWGLYALGTVSRWLQNRFADHWFLGPTLGLVADWPSTAAFGIRGRNPHGGYFVRGDVPRRLIAQLLATPADPTAPPRPFPAPPPIRSSALVIPV